MKTELFGIEETINNMYSSKGKLRHETCKTLLKRINSLNIEEEDLREKARNLENRIIYLDIFQ